MELNNRQPLFEQLSGADAIRLYELSGISFQKAGRKKNGVDQLKAPCPLHKERHASFFADASTGQYHCFGCGRGGDVVDYLEEFHGWDFLTTKNYICETLGLEKDKWKTGDRGIPPNTLFALNDAACRIYNEHLLNLPREHPCRQYLDSRRISSDVVKRFKLGFGGDSALFLYDVLRKDSNHTHELLCGSGLFHVSRDAQKVVRDAFSGRLIIPIRVRKGACGFSGRAIGNAETEPKYKNTEETRIFHKREILFNNDAEVQAAVARMGYVIVTEGYLDTIALVGHGVENAVVAVMGAKVTEEQARTLKILTRRVLLWLDNDDAGRRGTVDALERLIKLGIDCRVISIRGYKDSDELCAALPPEKADAVIRKHIWSPERWLAALADLTKPGADNDGKNHCISLFARVFRSCPSPSKKQEVIDFLSAKLHIERAFIVEPFQYREQFEKLQAVIP